MVKKVLFLLTCMSLCFSSVSFSGFKGFDVVVSGSWGSSDADFGIRFDGMKKIYPNTFYVTLDNKLIIKDFINARAKIYANGRVEKITKCQRDSAGNLSEECNISGKFIQIDADNNIWTDNSRWDYANEVDIEEYRETSLSGEVLSVYSTRPLPIGKIDWKKVRDTYVDIYFEDVSVRVNGKFDKFYRDQNGFVYTSAGYTAPGDQTGRWVKKYDICGKLITKFDLPLSEYEPYTAEQLASMAVPPRKPLNEYGPPVIGPDGSIYCWKRTPDTYSILKWEWVDDPSDPKPGPDTPANFQVIPATQGIYVTWDLSPQDPGCVDTYEIERATSADGIYTTLTTVPKGEQSFNDASAVQGQNYYYRLRAVADDLYSDFTNAMGGKWTGQ